jgi:hypothetical protein
MRILAKINSTLDDGLVIVVFTHIRNYSLCIMIIAAGFFAMESQHELLPGLFADEFAGVITVVVGFLLALLNLYVAVHRLSKSRFHIILNVLLIGIYIIITARIFEVIWHFRSAI